MDALYTNANLLAGGAWLIIALFLGLFVVISGISGNGSDE
jgi:Na+/H+ antiporter NhaD/arsenite permease-like protein